jgi:hypothetical protein
LTAFFGHPDRAEKGSRKGHKKDLASWLTMKTLAAGAQCARPHSNHPYNPERLRASPLLHVCEAASAPQPGCAASSRFCSTPFKPCSRRQTNRRPRRGDASTTFCVCATEQQFAQKEVAAQLGLSVRQYRRLQQAALEALVLQLDLAAAPPSDVAPPPPDDLAAGDAAADRLKCRTTEIRAVDQVLEDVLRLITPLAQRHAKVLQVKHSVPACAAAINPLVLRQALVTLLNASGLPHCSQRAPALRVEESAQQIKIIGICPRRERCDGCTGQARPYTACASRKTAHDAIDASSLWPAS